MAISKNITKPNTRRKIIVEKFSSKNDSKPEVLNKMNSHFIKACLTFNSQSNMRIIGNKVVNSLYLKPTTNTEINSVIKNLKNKTSVGENEVHLICYI